MTLARGKAVEMPAEHKPQRMRAGLKSPFPGGAAQAGDAFQRRGGGNRISGVNINRRAECFRPLPERIERGMIEILPVGMAVDHGAAKLEFAQAALKLVGGAARVLHREVGET